MNEPIDDLTMVEVSKDQAEERPAKRPNIDLLVFSGKNKTPENFLTTYIQALEYAI